MRVGKPSKTPSQLVFVPSAATFQDYRVPVFGPAPVSKNNHPKHSGADIPAPGRPGGKPQSHDLSELQLHDCRARTGHGPLPGDGHLAELPKQPNDYDHRVNLLRGNPMRYDTGVADSRCSNPMWWTIRRMMSYPQIERTHFTVRDDAIDIVREWTEHLEILVARAIRHLAEIRTGPPRFSDDAWEVVQLAV